MAYFSDEMKKFLIAMKGQDRVGSYGIFICLISMFYSNNVARICCKNTLLFLTKILQLDRAIRDAYCGEHDQCVPRRLLPVEATARARTGSCGCVRTTTTGGAGPSRISTLTRPGKTSAQKSPPPTCCSTPGRQTSPNTSSIVFTGSTKRRFLSVEEIIGIGRIAWDGCVVD